MLTSTLSLFGASRARIIRSSESIAKRRLKSMRRSSANRPETASASTVGHRLARRGGFDGSAPLTATVALAAVEIRSPLLTLTQLDKEPAMKVLCIAARLLERAIHATTLSKWMAAAAIIGAGLV
jgi:hypothetical protein